MAGPASNGQSATTYSLMWERLASPGSWSLARAATPVTHLRHGGYSPPPNARPRPLACPHGTDAPCETATCSQRHVRVWPLFVGVSLADGGVSVGHNRTRPPPCMRWRGPCSTYRSRLAGLPGSAGSGGPTAGASHPLLVPVSRLLPRPRSFPWGGARFRRESISTPQSSSGASVRGGQLRFFSLSTE